MFKPSRKNIIAGTTLVAIAIGFTLTVTSLNHSQARNQTVKTENNMLASTWNQSTVSYDGNKKMTVYRSPSCGCCGGWIAHMKKQGFEITDIKTNDMKGIKEKYNLAPELTSYHTAVIDGYVLEGHIPADDIKSFLTQKPSNLKGLAVPAMPIGTPGMESGDIKQPFAVIAFNQQGETTVFNQYDNY